MDRISKPRVFLSHSKKDIKFIERLERELRKCQIEPWLDEVEIRHGKPWLDAIFEDGIPSCDAVLVYFTESSLASKVVKKELDAGVITRLEDDSVALLPYVESPEVRSKLRSDIKALHVPEWNNENFDAILARCVAEVWRSFHERRVSQAIAQEKVKRLEAEREVKNLMESLDDKETICGRSYEELLEVLEKGNLLEVFLIIVREVQHLEFIHVPNEEEFQKIEELISIELLKRKGNTGRNSHHVSIDLTPQGRRFATEHSLKRLANSYKTDT